MDFVEKFVGFVDILGFSGLVESCERGSGLSLSEILAILDEMAEVNYKQTLGIYGHDLCPESKSLSKNIDFEISQISDCVVASSEISPAGALYLTNYFWRCAFRLLNRGLLCRGYITKGKVFHTSNQFIGTGYQEACSKEKGVKAFRKPGEQKGTPFIEVDSVVCDFMRDSGDKCVQEMFSRLVKDDGVVKAVFPFSRLSHSFSIGGFPPFENKFDPQKEKESNQIVRRRILDLKSKVMEFADQSNPSAMEKTRHYLAALDAQLGICDSTDEAIDLPNQPMRTVKIEDLFEKPTE